MSVRHRLLVADDDPGVRDLLRTHLANAGFEVHVAHDGAEALLQMRQVHPDALILDINMPKVDGFGVLQELRQSLKARNIPVLVLTARHAADDVRRAVSLGAKDYLAKPFNQALLLTRVARLLRRLEPDRSSGPSSGY